MARNQRPKPEPEIPQSIMDDAMNVEPVNEDEGTKDVLTRLTEALEGMAKRAGGGNEELMARLATALEKVSDNQLKGSELIASETRRAHRPSNEVVHNRSVFNRRGETLEDYTKPVLKCKIFMPWQLENESLTREEVELINLLQPGVYTVKRIDNTKIRVTVKVDYGVDGKKPSNMVVSHETGFNNDNFKLMPPLADFVRQMLRQHDDQRIVSAARNVMDDETEEALIEAGEILTSL